MLIDDKIVLRLELGELGLQLADFLAMSSFEFRTFAVLQFELLDQVIDFQLVVRRAGPH